MAPIYVTDKQVVSLIYHRVHALGASNLRLQWMPVPSARCKRRGSRASQAALRHVAAYWHLQREADAVVPSLNSAPARGSSLPQAVVCCRELRYQPAPAVVSARPGPLSIEARSISYQGPATVSSWASLGRRAFCTPNLEFDAMSRLGS